MHEIPPAVVGVPVGVGGYFFQAHAWYYFSAYIQDGNNWTHLHSHGPVWLTDGEAQEEFFSTVEQFWGRSVFAWKWTGTYWQLEMEL